MPQDSEVHRRRQGAQAKTALDGEEARGGDPDAAPPCLRGRGGDVATPARIPAAAAAAAARSAPRPLRNAPGWASRTAGGSSCSRPSRPGPRRPRGGWGASEGAACLREREMQRIAGPGSGPGMGDSEDEGKKGSERGGGERKREGGREREREREERAREN